MIKSYCKMIILLYNECIQGDIMNVYIVKIKDNTCVNKPQFQKILEVCLKSNVK